MPKFKYLYGGTDANWEEHLYHKSFQVENGIIETDDELDIDALLRRGWEQVEDDQPDTPAQAKKAVKSKDAE